MYEPTLCYHCQTGSLFRVQKDKSTTLETRRLRRTFNVTRRNMKRDYDVRRVAGITVLAIDYVERQKMKWFGYLGWMKKLHSQQPQKWSTTTEAQFTWHDEDRGADAWTPLTTPYNDEGSRAPAQDIWHLSIYCGSKQKLEVRSELAQGTKQTIYWFDSTQTKQT